MTKITLLIAVASVAIAASASAQTMDGTKPPEAKKYAYECAVTKSSPATDDPSYKVVVLVEEPDSIFSVVHTTASGKYYDRANQYTDVKTGPLRENEDWVTSPLIWIGTYSKSPDLSMVGMIGSSKDKLFYRETLYKKIKGKQVAQASIESTCHQVKA
jgi:hypothetical protein